MGFLWDQVCRGCVGGAVVGDDLDFAGGDLVGDEEEGAVGFQPQFKFHLAQGAFLSQGGKGAVCLQDELFLLGEGVAVLWRVAQQVVDAGGEVVSDPLQGLGIGAACAGFVVGIGSAADADGLRDLLLHQFPGLAKLPQSIPSHGHALLSLAFCALPASPLGMSAVFSFCPPYYSG